MASKLTLREVAADLVEATPGSGALGQWLLASPLLIFLAWLWVDLFAHYSPLPWYWFDVVLALPLFALLVVVSWLFRWRELSRFHCGLVCEDGVL